MKTITAKWFECSIRYDKMDENGLAKKVTEQYVVDAMTYTEAENRITEEVISLLSTDCEITSIKPAQFKEVAMFEDNNANARFYKMKVAFITLDEKTGKEKETSTLMLVEGTSLRNALDNVDNIMKGTLGEYTSVNAARTNVVDILLHD